MYTCDRFRRLFFAWADRILSVGRLLCCVFLDRFCAAGGVYESAAVLGWHGKSSEQSLRAILIGSFSVALIRSGDSTKIMIASIGLFVLISIAIYIYTVMGQTDVELPDQERKQEEEQDYFSAFADTYALTEREQEVLKMLLASDEEVQEIANRLYISRAMLYRYISSLNKKTDTNSRIGLIQFYYTWKLEKKADRDD